MDNETLIVKLVDGSEYGLELDVRDHGNFDLAIEEVCRSPTIPPSGSLQQPWLRGQAGSRIRRDKIIAVRVGDPDAERALAYQEAARQQVGAQNRG